VTLLTLTTQRDAIIEHNAYSIDNEIAQIAHTISHFNKTEPQQVCFSSLHFASDYLRTSAEIDSEIAYDLSNNRHAKALKHKAKIMHELFAYLIRYMRSK
jgi:hypothetical protein